MKDLLYFSSIDLMIQVGYQEQGNMIFYHSSRNLSLVERVLVEQYILTKVAVKTSYYKKAPARLEFRGKSEKVLQEYSDFHKKKTKAAILEKTRTSLNVNKDATDAVSQLLTNSEIIHLTETIGRKIIDLKKCLKSDQKEIIMQSWNQLEQLVNQYNKISPNKTSIMKIIPTEAKKYVKKQ